MDMTQIDEQWLDIPRVEKHKKAIVSLSNTGKYRRFDGTTGYLDRRQSVRYYGNKDLCYRIIAEHFLITVRRPDQTCIDHITHEPTEYSVNDIRNLRWCTNTENMNFEEAKRNMSKAKKGSLSGEKNPMWKGNNVSTPGSYVRAKKLYQAGKITEEEFQPYRDSWAEHQRQRKIAMKTSSPI